jgi:hypothetical protein
MANNSTTACIVLSPGLDQQLAAARMEQQVVSQLRGRDRHLAGDFGS